MNIAIVDGDLPYPANADNRVRTPNLPLRLMRRHRITYLHYAGADEETHSVAAYLRERGIATHAVLPKSRLAFYVRLAAAPQPRARSEAVVFTDGWPTTWFSLMGHTGSGDPLGAIVGPGEARPVGTYDLPGEDQ